MKVMLMNEGNTVGVCDLEPADSIERFIRVDIALVAEALKITKSFGYEGYTIGVVKSNNGARCMCLIPDGSTTTAIMIAELGWEDELKAEAAAQSLPPGQLTLEMLETQCEGRDNPGEV